MSQFLLDTQIFIWFAEGDIRLPKNIKMKLLESEGEIFLAQSVRGKWRSRYRSKN